MVARAVRDVAFPINPEVATVGIDDCDAVEARTAGQFIEADRQYHLQLLGDFLEVQDRRVALGGSGQLQVIRVGLLTEIRGLKQLLQQDDLRAFGGGLTYQALGIGKICGGVPGASHLGGGDGNDTGHGLAPQEQLGRSSDTSRGLRLCHDSRVSHGSGWPIYIR